MREHGKEGRRNHLKEHLFAPIKLSVLIILIITGIQADWQYNHEKFKFLLKFTLPVLKGLKATIWFSQAGFLKSNNPLLQCFPWSIPKSWQVRFVCAELKYATAERLLNDQMITRKMNHFSDANPLKKSFSTQSERRTSFCIVYWVSLDSSWQPFEQWLLGNVPQRINNNGRGSALLYLVNTDSFLSRALFFKKEKIFLPEGIRGCLIKDTCKQNKWQRISIIFHNSYPLYKAGLRQT